MSDNLRQIQAALNELKTARESLQEARKDLTEQPPKGLFVRAKHGNGYNNKDLPSALNRVLADELRSNWLRYRNQAIDLAYRRVADAERELLDATHAAVREGGK